MIDLKFAAEIFRKAGKIEEYQKIIDLMNDSFKNKEKIEELKNENKELQEKLRFKGDLNFKKNAYWKKSNKDGPYCQACWDDKNKLVRILAVHGTHYKCNVCNGEARIKVEE